jgi:hypothetical protein
MVAGHDPRTETGASVNTKFHEANPAFSPDGKWLAFTSDESGRPELYVDAFMSGDAPARLGNATSFPGQAPRRSAGGVMGSELFYLDFDGRVQAVSVRLSHRPEFGPATPLFTISTEARVAIHSVVGFDVSPDGNSFVMVRSLDTPLRVITQNWEALLPSSRTSGANR